MNRAKSKLGGDAMRSEYDFSGAVRGTYAGQVARRATVLVLEPEVAKVFSSSGSVNSALRALVAIARRKKRKKIA